MVFTVSSRGAALLSQRAALSLLLCSVALGPAFAQDIRPRVNRQDSSRTFTLETVTVTGRRGEVAGVPVERSLDGDAILSYGASTVADLVGELAYEIGEDEPVILVNGERIEDFGDVSDLPIEAVERVDILPNGSGAAAGASPRGRVINVVLKRELRTVVSVIGRRAATEGAYVSTSGEITATRIQGPNRTNLAFRTRDETRVLEHDRGVTPFPLAYPYGPLGTVLPVPGSGATEIDPALSAAAGRPVARAAVPPGSGPRTLSAFAANAGLEDSLELARFRTLLPDAQFYEASFSETRKFSEEVTGSVNARASTNESHYLSGAAYGLFLVEAGRPESPFATDVVVAAARPDPLRSRSRTETGSVASNLRWSRGDLQLGANVNYSRSDRRYDSERQDFDQTAQPVAVPWGMDAFGGSLGDLLTIRLEQSRTTVENLSAQLSASDTPVDLPAGPLRLTATGGLNRSSVDSFSTFGGLPVRNEQTREELGGSLVVFAPLASRRAGFLSALGELNLNLEAAAGDAGRAGSPRRTLALVDWAPEERLRFNASVQVSVTPPALELLADAPTVSPEIPYFDAVTGQTTFVTVTYGGAPDLRSQTATLKRVGVTATPWRRYNLQITAEYWSVETRDPIASLPPNNIAIMAAFPDRFVRNGAGELISVDTRPLNFEHQTQEQARSAISFVVPVGGSSDPRGPRARSRVEINAAASWNLRDDLLIRDGLPAVDLLRGGGFGLSGGRSRRQADASAAFVSREWGFRVSGTWRDGSTLDLGQAAGGGALRFEPLTVVNLSGHVDLSMFAPESSVLKGSRLNLTLTNAANARQSIADENGFTPLNYQPAYRDPIGRSVFVEIRKSF